MPLTAGTRLGPYEILAPIGAGGMGEVYRAKDTRLDRTVAIKVLPAHLADNPELRQRFEREARAVSSLNHPHICTLYDIGRQDGIDFLVMEYLEGETLASRLSKGPMPAADGLRYAIEMADALALAHRQGVFHRDLKPGNIMLTKSGAKLLDFGLAKLAVGGAGPVAAETLTALTPRSGDLTQKGTILGTIQYMAPEQLEGKEADARTDIFAFGAVLYEMVTGQKAFAAKSQASLIAAIMHTDPAPVSAVSPVAPAALDRVVRACLAKDPEDRYQSARDLKRELEWIAQSGSQAATQAAMPAPAIARGKRRDWLAWALAGLAGLAALLVGAMHFSEKPSEMYPIRFSVHPPEKVSFGELIGNGPVLVSPDGLRLAFVGTDENGTSQLWVRPLDAAAAQPLAGTAGATYPFWSPDSRYLAFFADGKLKKVPVSGGPPQTLSEAPNGRGGSWAAGKGGAEGVIVFAPSNTVGLSRVSAGSGESAPVTALDASRQETSHRQPEFLPDGRHFLFVATSEKGEKTAIYIGDVEAKPGQASRRLMPGDSRASYAVSPSGPGHLLFVRENTLMAQGFNAERLQLAGEPVAIVEHVGSGGIRNVGDFSVSRNGVLAWRNLLARPRQLAWWDRQGKQLGGLDVRELYYGPALSADGERVALAKSNLQGSDSIWILDLRRGAASRFTFGPTDQIWPVWSPDGRRIAFSVLKGAARDLYWKDASGAGNEEPLLESGANKVATHWSPDGRFILYSEFNPKTRFDLWVLPLFGDRQPIPVLQTEFDELFGIFSPDGRWIAYASNESGRFEVYVRAFSPESAGSTGGKWQVSTSGGTFPVWRRDGKELYFLGGGKMVAVSITSGPSFQAGVPAPLFDIRGSSDPTDAVSAFHFDVSADGRRFLVSAPLGGGVAEPVDVCLNWRAMKK